MRSMTKIKCPHCGERFDWKSKRDRDRYMNVYSSHAHPPLEDEDNKMICPTCGKNIPVS